MNKMFFGGLIVSLLTMSLIGCSAGGGTDYDGYVTREHTVTLTYPNPNWPNATKAEAQESMDLWSAFRHYGTIEILDENIKEVIWDSLHLYWMEDNQQYRENCNIWLYDYSDQKIILQYGDEAYRYSWENRYTETPPPLGTYAEPVTFDLTIFYDVKY